MIAAKPVYTTSEFNLLQLPSHLNSRGILPRTGVSTFAVVRVNFNVESRTATLPWQLNVLTTPAVAAAQECEIEPGFYRSEPAFSFRLWFCSYALYDNIYIYLRDG